jgi:serine/threonine-protein kinase
VSVERFKREFEVSQQLPHTHIVEVTDFQATNDGSYVLVMEFLYGEELRATLKRQGGVRPARLVRLLSQVAIGLDAAHAKKLVHRDLKPDNLFLCQTTAGDMVKILDFGSVKDKKDTAKKLTVMGTTIGSPYYMSPEQAQGLETLDQRADVWAMGAIAFECIAGTVPFKGVNGPSILLEILTKDAPAPSTVADKPKYPIPPGVDRVVLQALKKTAGLRTASIGAFANELGAAYGLEGDHNRWATSPEADLDAVISSKLDALMASPAAEKKARDAADSFFGEDESLGAGEGIPGVMAPAPASAAAMATSPMSAIDDGFVPGVSRSKLGWWLVPVVVVVAILAGVLIAYLM